MKISFQPGKPVKSHSILRRAHARWNAWASAAFPMLEQGAGLALCLAAVLALSMLVSLQQVVSAGVVTAQQRNLVFAQQGMRSQAYGRCGSDTARRQACGLTVVVNDTTARNRLGAAACGRCEDTSDWWR